ncbi:MAG: DUF3572 domain-containing protein [Pseudomonadota bacterium]
MTPEASETLALHAFAWIVGQDDMRGVFMGSAGLSEDDLRHRADDPEFLGAVLDFLCMDDDWVIGFCDAHGLAYTDPMAARAALPGGQQVHWT